MGLLAESLIRDVPDFPQPGILFKDITPVLQSPAAFDEIVQSLAGLAREAKADAICGIESRGFVFGAPVALQLGLPFVPARKAGKLPYARIREEYSLEYGVNVVEMHEDAVGPGMKVVVVDDLLATGGTAAAAGRLIRRLGGQVAAYAFVIELGFLDGRKVLTDAPAHALIRF